MSFSEAKEIFEPSKLIIEGFLTIGINVFGLLANAVAIKVLYKTKLSNLFNKTLFILAIFALRKPAVDVTAGETTRVGIHILMIRSIR